MSQFDRIEQSQIEKIAKKVLAGAGGGGGGSGTVTSVTAGAGLTGGTITTSGTIAANFGSTASTICQGDDARLSDARTPTAHTHPQSDITNLVTDLAGKSDVGHTHPQSDITNLVSDLAGKSDVGHTHPQSDITNLVTDLAGKAAVVHSHVISDVTGLQTALDNKLDDSQLSTFGGTLIDDVDAATARATLGLGTAATSNTGDFAAAVHTHAMADVIGLVSSISSITTTLAGKSDVGHTHVIADVTGLQTALDNKLDDSQLSAFGATLIDDADAATARTTLGLGTAATSNTGDFAAASHTHPQSDITNLVTDLANKSNVGHTHIIADVTGLQTALDNKLDDSQLSAFGATLIDDVDAATARTTLGLGTAATSNTGDFAAAVHTHSMADVVGLVSAISSLTSSLAGKSDVGHTHALSDLTQSGASTNDVVTWNGSQWAPAAPSGGGAPVGASYIVKTADGTLTNEFALGTMTTGIVKVTTTTGDLTTAVGSDLPDNIPLNHLASGGASAGNVLTFNNLTSAWEPAAPSGGAGSIDALTDVDTTTDAPRLGSTLIWDGSNWVPGDVRPSVQPLSGNRIIGMPGALTLGTQQSTGYNNVLRAYPFMSRRSFSSSGLTIACTTAQATTSMEVQLALYEAGSDGWPSGLPIEYMSGSALNGTSVGFKTFTFGSPITIQAHKMYWVAHRWLLVSGTAPTWRAVTTSHGYELATATTYSAATTPYWNINISHTYGVSSAWHNFTTTPITAVSQLATANMPCIWVNVA